MKPLEQLICPHLLTLQPYQSARLEYTGTAATFLDANEAPTGTYNRYPDPLQHALKQRLAERHGVATEQIFVGNGSDEAIDLLMRLFCRAGKDSILTLPPTYGMYKVAAAINHVAVEEVPLVANFQPDVAAVLAAQHPQTKLLFVCTPNNPTGNEVERDRLRQLIEGFEGIVVVDEAYQHFAPGESAVQWLAEYPNLVVLQTLSKAWGLAGLRVGMAFAQPALIQWLTAIKPPYNVNAATQQLALTALAQTTPLEQRLQSVASERGRLAKALEESPLVVQVYPSAANFLLVKTTDADGIYAHLIQQGIVVRNRSRVPQCAGCLRFTIGTPEENTALLHALQTYQTSFSSTISTTS